MTSKELQPRDLLYSPAWVLCSTDEDEREALRWVKKKTPGTSVLLMSRENREVS